MKKKPLLISVIIILCLLVIGVTIFIINKNTEASSIGIIGGAEGPTAFYFEMGNFFIPVILIISLIIIIGIVYLVRRNK